MYLDDGLVSAKPKDYSTCLNSSIFVRNTLYSAGFLPNEAKSVGQPTPKLVWLGYDINLLNHLVFIPVKRISNPLDAANKLLVSYSMTTPRILAQFTGKIISMGFVLGNITRIMSRYSYFDIVKRASAGIPVSGCLNTHVLSYCFGKVIYRPLIRRAFYSKRLNIRESVFLMQVR